MQVAETLNELVSKFLYCLFRKLFVILQKFEKVTSRAELEDDPEMIACLVPVMEAEDILVLQGVEDPNFVH